MANSNPAQTMGEVEIRLYKVRDLPGGKGTMRTHHSYNLRQADRAGVIRLDEADKIIEVLDEAVTVILPKGWGEEDVFALTPAPQPLKDDIIVPLTKEGIAGIDAKIEEQQR